MSIKDQIARYILICNYLKINPTHSNFSDRKRIQKIFYILKIFNLDLDYKYNWYKYGPYSPKLTDVYYQANKFLSSGELNKYILNEKDKKVLDYAVSFLEPIINNVEILEYYASILYIRKDMIFFDIEKNENTIEKEIAQLKPLLFKKKSYEEAIEKFKEYNIA